MAWPDDDIAEPGFARVRHANDGGEGVALRLPSAVPIFNLLLASSGASVENQDCTAWVMPTREIR